MKALIVFLTLFFMHCSWAEADDANYSILSRWIQDLSPSDSSLERHQRDTFSEPLIVGEMLFLGTEKPELQARSVKTGEILWTTKLAGSVQGAWVTDGQNIFGGDTEGTIYSIDHAKGSVRWSALSKGLFVSRPLLIDDLVVLMTSTGSLQAYDRETGAWRWQQSDPKRANLGLISHGGPQTFMDLVISGFPSGLLVALDKTSGNSQWSEVFMESAAAPMALNDIKAIYANDDFLLASSFAGSLKAWKKSAASKRLLWEKNLSLYDSPVLNEGRFLLSARDGKVYALDESTGFQIWSYEVPRGLAHKPLVHNGKIWITTTAGDLLVLSQAGEVIARKSNIESPYWSSPLAIVGGDILALSSRGLLRRLSLAKTH